jgi:hypothetical protein
MNSKAVHTLTLRLCDHWDQDEARVLAEWAVGVGLDGIAKRLQEGIPSGGKFRERINTAHELLQELVGLAVSMGLPCPPERIEDEDDVWVDAWIEEAVVGTRKTPPKAAVSKTMS